MIKKNKIPVKLIYLTGILIVFNILSPVQHSLIISQFLLHGIILSATHLPQIHSVYQLFRVADILRRRIGKTRRRNKNMRRRNEILPSAYCIYPNSSWQEQLKKNLKKLMKREAEKLFVKA